MQTHTHPTIKFTEPDTTESVKRVIHQEMGEESRGGAAAPNQGGPFRHHVELAGRRGVAGERRRRPIRSIVASEREKVVASHLDNYERACNDICDGRLHALMVRARKWQRDDVAPVN